MFIHQYFKPSAGVTVSSHKRRALFGNRTSVKYQQHGQPLSDEQLSRLVDALQDQQKRDDQSTG